MKEMEKKMAFSTRYNFRDRYNRKPYPSDDYHYPPGKPNNKYKYQDDFVLNWLDLLFHKRPLIIFHQNLTLYTRMLRPNVLNTTNPNAGSQYLSYAKQSLSVQVTVFHIAWPVILP